ncbi:MAG TPA: DUF4159 domain-containing protein [Blastocatellia bacterium]|nr:DUF4159 domain-containing protein [Blastocatellia bacterium]
MKLPSARQLLLLPLLLLTILPVVWPLQFRPSPRLPDYLRNDHSARLPEYTFARLIYSSHGWRETWTTDYPKADHQFIYGLRGWAKSLLAIADDPTTVSMSDPRLFTYPLIYAVEPGFMELSEEDAEHLREYLLRGGMLMLDDFWGEYEWQNVQKQMKKVFPEYSIQELPLSHSLFHCYFDIEEVVQVPQSDNWIYYHQTSEKGGIIPHYEGIIAEDGRIVVFIARNMDNGDAWEWIDDPRYSLKYGLAAYKLGMNVIVYSMTH